MRWLNTEQRITLWLVWINFSTRYWTKHSKNVGWVIVISFSVLWGNKDPSISSLILLPKVKKKKLRVSWWHCARKSFCWQSPLQKPELISHCVGIHLPSLPWLLWAKPGEIDSPLRAWTLWWRKWSTLLFSFYLVCYELLTIIHFNSDLDRVILVL